MTNFTSPTGPATRHLVFVLGAVALVGVHGVYAQDAVPAKASGKEYSLAKASSFNAPAADARNPFWPIGWTPGPVVAAQAREIVYDVKPEDFTLTTTSVDYPPMAIINGRSYAVGETVPVTSAPQETVRVKKITDGSVILENRGRELSVRPTLGAPRPRK